MDRNESKLRTMLLEAPPEKWPLLARAMAWERGTAGPPWMDHDERDWFWDTCDRETVEAAKRAEAAAAWERFEAALSAPFVRIVEWMAARLPK